jgi:hypothetical protein
MKSNREKWNFGEKGFVGSAKNQKRKWKMLTHLDSF